ncbi:MAG: 2-hydroxyacyl-CoA dehydratase subunit D [Candidatus Hodarchaeota archaeon]
MDSSLWFGAIKNLEGIMGHVMGRSKSEGERAYYELYAAYFQKVREAMKEGKDIAAHCTFIPPEIFHAMDIVPILLVSSSGAMTVCSRNYKEALDSSSKFGVALETCSGHRIQMAHFVEGWFPRPRFIVHMGTGCDAFSASSHISAEIYGCPDYYVDVPYEYNDRGLEYLTGEFERLVSFAEEITGRKMDWDRLTEIVAKTAEMTSLYREIAELRKAVPSPMESRRAWQSYWMYWINAGTSDGVKWFRTVRDEVKDRVNKGVGAVPNERVRLLDLFMPPQYSYELQDWMGEEYGALFVNESLIFQWGNEVLDPSRPLEALAKRYFIAPVTRCALGRGRDFLTDAVKQAREYKADGAVFWAQNACRQTGIMRSLKDALNEEAGIPTLVLDCDIMDPSFVSVTEMKKKLKDFLEILKYRAE